MTSSDINTSNFGSRITDLIVLSTSFLLFAVATGFTNPVQIIMDLFFYVAVVFVCLRLCKRVVFEYIHSSTRIVTVLLGNILGLVVGAHMLLLLGFIFPGIGGSALVNIFASIMAFFILGTLSPMVKSSHGDIIHH